MQSSESPATHPGNVPAAVPTVTVRYWAAARAAAGVPQELITGETLAEVLDTVRHTHAADVGFARVLEAASLLLDEQPVARGDVATVVLHDGSVIDVLPPFAGG